MKTPLITIKLLEEAVLLRSPAMPEMFVEANRADVLLDRLSRVLKVIVEEYESRGQEITLPQECSIEGHAFISLEPTENGRLMATSGFLPELITEGVGLHDTIRHIADALGILSAYYKVEGKTLTGVT